MNRRERSHRIRSEVLSNHRKYEALVDSEYLFIPSGGLPAGGWIQSCVFCNYETTSVEAIGDYKLYCCNRCQRKSSRREKRAMAASIVQYLSQLK